LENISAAKAAGAQVILNPAPAAELPEEIYEKIDHLILNETETEILSKLEPGKLSITELGLSDMTKLFLDRGLKSIVITLGEKGVYFNTVDRNGRGDPGVWLPAQKADVVDTTAAGDTFVGAYAVRIASALADLGTLTSAVIGQAVEFAILAATRTVEKPGAQSAIPWLDELKKPEAVLPELGPVPEY
jgi:ribokinase